MRHNFKVGDVVIARDNFEVAAIKGCVGTVHSNFCGSLAIEFKSKVMYVAKQKVVGHSCAGLCREGFGWFVPENYLELFDETPFEGNV